MNKVKRTITTVTAAMSLLVMSAVAAFASGGTDVATELSSALGEVNTLILGAIGALFVIAITGVGVRVGLKYTKRGSSAA